MSILRISLRPPRCYILGHRIHHGTFGLLLVASDLHDARVWFKDLWRES